MGITPSIQKLNSISEVMDCLMWGAYKANRGYGCSHEQLVKIGVGNDSMRDRYDSQYNHNDLDAVLFGQEK